MKITPAQIMTAGPCTGYSLERVTSLWAGRDALTPAEIGALDIPVEDRLWAIIYCVLTDRQCRLFTCDCMERILILQRKVGRNPDSQSQLAVVVARLYVAGDATEEELYAARANAHAAWAHVWPHADADAWDAANVAWGAARDAVRAAAWAHADTAAKDVKMAAWAAAKAIAWAAKAPEVPEYEWQLARALEYAKEKENNHE